MARARPCRFRARPSPSRLRLSLAIALAMFAGAALADEAKSPDARLDQLAALADADAGAGQALFLEVFFGERPIGLIASVRLIDGRLYAEPAELREIGLLLPEGLPIPDGGLLALDDLPGLAYDYDRPNQRLVLQVPPSLRPRQRLGYARPDVVHAARDPGVLLGYDVYAQQYRGRLDASLTTSVRWFGRAGTLETTGISRAGEQASGYQRLETRWSYSDPERLWTWTVGDTINGGLAWTRPVRMGGVQWRRNFGVRPDLVTLPIPQFSGSAALPSSVDLYIDNIKQLGAEVQDGPFVVDGLPRINGAGEATLVVRDVSGRTTTTTIPLYVDSQRLARGLSDFSLEVGKVRLGYGDDRERYASEVAASGSWRRGMTDALTLEAHAEGTAGLRLGGLGAVWSPGNRWGLVSLSYARSEGDAGGGDQRTVGYQWNSARYGLDLQSQRRSDGYRDLGSRIVATGSGSVPIDPLFPGDAPGGTLTEAPVYQILDQDRATAWLPVRQGNLAFTWLHWRDSESVRSRTRSLSWNQNFGARVSLSLTAFDDDQAGRGGSLILSLPLGGRTSASASVDHVGDRTNALASLRRDAPYAGGLGWQLVAGDRDGAYAQGNLSLRGRYGDAWIGAERYDGHTNAFAQGGGSVVLMAGQALPSRRIGDSFAVVSTGGVADVPILSENRTYGRTNAKGYLLLPELRGWQRNRVAIDPDELGADYRLGALEQFATPADRAGALVRFDVQRVRPLRAVLLDAAGAVAPAGARGALDTGAAVLVGFDGEIYLDDVSGASAIELDLDGGRCYYPIPAGATTRDGVLPRLSCRKEPR